MARSPLLRLLARIEQRVERWMDKNKVDAATRDEVENFFDHAQDAAAAAKPGVVPLAVTLDATVNAVGTNAFATATFDAKLVDKKNVDVFKAKTTLEGAAEGGAGFVSTDASVDVSGADIVLKSTKTVTGENFEQTTTRVLAIDLAFFNPSQPLVLEAETQRTTARSKPVPEGQKAEATFDFVLDGPGAGGDVAIDTTAFEGALSSATVSADFWIA